MFSGSSRIDLRDLKDSADLSGAFTCLAARWWAGASPRFSSLQAPHRDVEKGNSYPREAHEKDGRSCLGLDFEGACGAMTCTARYACMGAGRCGVGCRSVETGEGDR